MSLGLLSWLFTIPKVALLFCPKLLLQQPPLGRPNWTRLNVLKNSVRNCNPNLSSGPKFVVLKIAMSQLLIPAPRIVGSTRDSSPKPQAAGAVKQFTLNQTNPADEGVCDTPLSHPGTTLGRRAKFCEKLAFERGVDPPYEIGSGKPF